MEEMEGDYLFYPNARIMEKPTIRSIQLYFSRLEKNGETLMDFGPYCAISW